MTPGGQRFCAPTAVEAALGEVNAQRGMLLPLWSLQDTLAHSLPVLRSSEQETAVQSGFRRREHTGVFAAGQASPQRRQQVSPPRSEQAASHTGDLLEPGRFQEDVLDRMMGALQGTHELVVGRKVGMIGREGIQRIELPL